MYIRFVQSPFTITDGIALIPTSGSTGGGGSFSGVGSGGPGGAGGVLRGSNSGIPPNGGLGGIKHTSSPV